MKNKRPKKEIKIEFIPVYIPDAEFQEKKAEIQNLIARMVVSVHKKELLKQTESTGVRSPHAENDKAVQKPLSRKIKSNNF
ncbi:MAG: hypothetical protein LW878_13890 [Proteobacteria bacterium]|jgi:hypothetical protein|nr:hypothetical protein [Pseudomonadota bacterium]